MTSPNTQLRGSKPKVALVHGIWCKAPVMWYLAWRLRQQGFATRCLSYASVTRSFAANCDLLSRRLQAMAAHQAEVTGSPAVHLVAHSYGGLLLTQMLASGALPVGGRLVLLGSPVRGSQLVRGVVHGLLRRSLLGHAAHSVLVSGIAAVSLQAVAARNSVGVVYGTRNFSFFGLIFGRPASGDGLVSESETQFPGARHVALPVSHAGLLLSKTVAEHLAQFLRSGDFPMANGQGGS